LRDESGIVLPKKKLGGRGNHLERKEYDDRHGYGARKIKKKKWKGAKIEPKAKNLGLVNDGKLRKRKMRKVKAF